METSGNSRLIREIELWLNSQHPPQPHPHPLRSSLSNNRFISHLWKSPERKLNAGLFAGVGLMAAGWHTNSLPLVLTGAVLSSGCNFASEFFRLKDIFRDDSAS